MHILAGILFIVTSLLSSVVLGQDVVVAVSEARIPFTLETVSCTCPRDFAPVCGSNGKSYTNECILKCISCDNVKKGLPSIKLLRQGPCPQPTCGCSYDLQRVCASDNETYTNACFVTCENSRRLGLGIPLINIASTKPCNDWRCKCSDSYVPVCGSDGETYDNICVLECNSRRNEAEGYAPIRLQSSNECKSYICGCSLDYVPICGSDGRTFDSRCVFDCHNKRRQLRGLPPYTVAHEGECLKEEECPYRKGDCPKTYDPYCASDGNTYLNQCVLNCENAMRGGKGQPPLTVVKKGECPCNCPHYYKPVCASDNKTYPNQCLLDCENKRRALKGLSLLTVVKKGECSCRSACSKDYDPVCASDQNTYYSICPLECENKWRKMQGLPSLTVIRTGECPCPCPKNYDPLCGDDNKTYGNACMLKCVNDARAVFDVPPVKVAYEGECACECPQEKKLVCGSNGNTYLNACVLNCYNKIHKDTDRPYISLANYGPCKIMRK